MQYHQTCRTHTITPRYVNVKIEQKKLNTAQTRTTIEPPYTFNGYLKCLYFQDMYAYMHAQNFTINLC